MGIYRYYLATRRLPYFFITAVQTQEIQGKKLYISAINFKLNSLVHNMDFFFLHIKSGLIQCIFCFFNKKCRIFKLKNKNICTLPFTNKITIECFLLLDKVSTVFKVSLLPNIKFCNPLVIVSLLKGLLISFLNSKRDHNSYFLPLCLVLYFTLSCFRE